MATVISSSSRQYKDLDLNFLIHPVRKDINKHKDEMAVINSIKNLMMTNHYERPFQPDLGSNVRRLLFENLDKITAISMDREIRQVVQNYEPRAQIKTLDIVPDMDNNGFSVRMEFYIMNMTDPVTINFFLERVR
jgi:phage baseplate assembly protein W